MSKAGGKSMRLPWVTFVLGAAVVVLGLSPDEIQEAFQYDREAILLGEIWRLLAGHLVHWSTSHLLWDLLVFLSCGTILEWIHRRWFVLFMSFAMFTVSLGLLVFQPDMCFYRGLSAVDMALFALVCMTGIHTCLLRKHYCLAWLWSLSLLACFLKPAFEIILGKALFAGAFGAGVALSTLSHILGAGSTVLLGIVIHLWGWFDRSRKKSMVAGTIQRTSCSG